MAYGKAARTDEGFGLQYAALPWRKGRGGPEVLLVTSRESGRWVVPKGWPMRRKAPHEAAAREAFEEAGVRGQVGKAPVGSYSYLKSFKNRFFFRCEVQVFPLEVNAELKRWPEQDERTRRWFPVGEAAAAVEEPELRKIIRDWSETAS